MSEKQYVTRAGWHKLHNELKYLWETARPRAAQMVAEAAALGDRSENAEYIYGKKVLRDIDRRVIFLRKRLKLLHIADPHPQQEGRVFFGAWVTLVDQHGDNWSYRLVGSDEFDPSQHWISIHSPVARALLGKRINDTVNISTPKGKITYQILAINYHAP